MKQFKTNKPFQIHFLKKSKKRLKLHKKTLKSTSLFLNLISLLKLINRDNKTKLMILNLLPI